MACQRPSVKTCTKCLHKGTSHRTGICMTCRDKERIVKNWRSVMAALRQQEIRMHGE